MAALRFSRISALLRSVSFLKLTSSTIIPSSGNIRNGSYSASPKELSPENYTKFREVTGDHWVFVERLKPPMFVPSLPKDLPETLPSGWKPPPESPPNLPYFVPRTKNHMIPVYLNFEEIRNQRKITIIKLIEGDIWALERDLKAHLNTLKGNTIVSQVHEVAMFIKFRGDHVLAVTDWLLKSGF